MLIYSSAPLVQLLLLKKINFMKTKKNTGGYERLRVGANIRKWRNIKDIKQKDLAASLRLSEAAISNMENDITDITLSQLEDISIKLDIPLEKLFIDPQETLTDKLYADVVTTSPNQQQLMEKEFMYNIFNKMQEKDEQLKMAVDVMIQTMKTMSSQNINGKKNRN